MTVLTPSQRCRDPRTIPRWQQDAATRPLSAHCGLGVSFERTHVTSSPIPLPLEQVLTTNSSLTSVNLADNRIGLPGVISLCKHLQENSSLAELSLKGNELTDRAAVPLAEALKASTSLTKVDLSYNSFGEEAGRHFGEMLNGHSHLLDVNLKWNALKARGGAAVAEGLKSNQVQVLRCARIRPRVNSRCPLSFPCSLVRPWWAALACYERR